MASNVGGVVSRRPRTLNNAGAEKIGNNRRLKKAKGSAEKVAWKCGPAPVIGRTHKRHVGPVDLSQRIAISGVDVLVPPLPKVVETENDARRRPGNGVTCWFPLAAATIRLINGGDKNPDIACDYINIAVDDLNYRPAKRTPFDRPTTADARIHAEAAVKATIVVLDDLPNSVIRIRVDPRTHRQTWQRTGINIEACDFDEVIDPIKTECGAL